MTAEASLDALECPHGGHSIDAKLGVDGTQTTQKIGDACKIRHDEHRMSESSELDRMGKTEAAQEGAQDDCGAQHQGAPASSSTWLLK